MGNGSSMPTGHKTQGKHGIPKGRQGIKLKASEACHKAGESHKKT